MISNFSTYNTSESELPKGRIELRVGRSVGSGRVSGVSENIKMCVKSVGCI